MISRPSSCSIRPPSGRSRNVNRSMSLRRGNSFCATNPPWSPGSNTLNFTCRCCTGFPAPSSITCQRIHWSSWTMGSSWKASSTKWKRMRSRCAMKAYIPVFCRRTFPVPYLSWSELQDSMGKLLVLDLGYGNSEQNSDLSSCFYPNQRYAGQLKNFVDDLLTDAQVVKEQYIVSRQVPRIKEVWLEKTKTARDRSQGAGLHRWQPV